MMTKKSDGEGVEVFSCFVNNLIENMQYPPSEVHKEMSDRPWDFV